MGGVETAAVKALHPSRSEKANQEDSKIAPINQTPKAKAKYKKEKNLRIQMQTVLVGTNHQGLSAKLDFEIKKNH